jgi:hypothetical protein
MAGIFGVFWLSQANRNFFVTDGHYALSLQFFPVYFRTLLRLLSQMLPFLAAFLIIERRSGTRHGGSGSLFRAPSTLFFAAMLLLTIVPYSFLTYLDHIPSRNTYFPSVALAGLNGILFAGGYAALRSTRAKALFALFLSVVVLGNSAYIWLKKDPQYVERAAPTRVLIDVLNEPDLRARYPMPFTVCEFPLHAWIGDSAVTGFTSFTKEDVVFSRNCDVTPSGTTLVWNQQQQTYLAIKVQSE